MFLFWINAGCLTGSWGFLGLNISLLFIMYFLVYFYSWLKGICLVCKRWFRYYHSIQSIINVSKNIIKVLNNKLFIYLFISRLISNQYPWVKYSRSNIRNQKCTLKRHPWMTNEANQTQKKECVVWRRNGKKIIQIIWISQWRTLKWADFMPQKVFN